MAVLLDKLLAERFEPLFGGLVAGLYVLVDADSYDEKSGGGEGLQKWPVRNVRPAVIRKIPMICERHCFSCPAKLVK